MIKLLHPIKRFEGWEPTGLYKRPADTRTVEELKGTIEAWSRRLGDVKEILPELKTMNPKHLGLVADTIELSQKPANAFKDVNLANSGIENGFFSPLKKLMMMFPVVSKKNPHAMEFSQEVVDTTGKLMSKFYLKAAADTEFLLDEGVDKNFEKAIPFVEDMAHHAMSLKPVNFDRQEEFVGEVLAVIEKESDPEKIALLPDIYKTLRYSSSIKKFNFDELIKSKVSPDIIKENMKTLKEDLGAAYSYGKVVDVNEYLIKDPEDTRIPFRNLNSDKLHRYSANDLSERSRTGNYI